MSKHRVLPQAPVSASRAVQTFREPVFGYTREEAIAEAQRAGDFEFSGSQSVCPFQVDVNGMVRSIARGDFDAALASVLTHHPWPGILGRHCFRPCEGTHKLPGGAESLNISALERATSDYGDRSKFPFTPGNDSGRRVAVIGAGSASSAAVYRLRSLGHRVTVYEQLPVSGGMMFAGYPEFRLPVSVLQRENTLEQWGAEVRYGEEIDAVMIRALVAEYDAVLLGTGKFVGLRMGIPGEDLEGVWDALRFLTDVKLGKTPNIGERIVVTGAGYTAQDASRTCLRLGRRDVKILYRKTREHMPVFPGLRQRFVERQIEEGAPYLFRTTPIRIVGKEGRVVGVECVRTEPGPPDDQGVATAVPVPGSNFFLQCDTVIEAVGEKVDLSYLPPEVGIDERGHVRADAPAFMTTLPKLFASGEMTGIGGTVYAFSHGFTVAEAIDRRMSAASSPKG